MPDPGPPPPSVAYASIRDTEKVFIAESIDVLARLLAVRLVAELDPTLHASFTAVIQQALLEERWADALVAYMDATGTAIDIFENEAVWTDERMSLEDAFIDIRLSPVFRAR